MSSSEYRVVGYMKAPEFAALLHQALPTRLAPPRSSRISMPPASRTLVMVLVALAGVLAGFVSYRAARAPASISAVAPPAIAAQPADLDDKPAPSPEGAPAGRSRTRCRT